MRLSSFTKNMLGLGVGALMIGSGMLIQNGCPTGQAQSQQGLARCATMGGYNLCAQFIAPDARKTEEFGRDMLRQFGTSAEALDARYAQNFPNGIGHLNVTVPSGTCLETGPARTFYNTVVSKISSVFNATADCLETAHTGSKMRSEARKVTRAVSCNTGDDDFLKARDACTHGTKEPGFLYFVGKYAAQAVEKCKNGICSVKDATCAMLLKASQKTNAAFNQLASNTNHKK